MEGLALTVIPLNCGQLEFNRRYFTGGSKDSILKLPIFAFLILHPRGMLLFDTGFSPELWSGVSTIELTSGLNAKPGNSEGILREIEKQRYSHKDISIIVNSHNHLDHAGGNSLFPGVSLVLQGREEEMCGDYDLFGDGSILLLPTPGHSGDHQSLLVRGGDKQVLLTGDACFRPNNLTNLLPPLILEDRGEALKSMERLRDMSKARETVVLTSHDPYATGEKISLK